MNQKYKNLLLLIKKEYVSVVCAFCFISSFMANVLVFYMTGNRSLTLRRILSWSIILIGVLCLGIKLWNVFKQRKSERRKIILLLITPFINGLFIMIAWITSGFSSYVLRSLAGFVFYCLSVSLVAILMLDKDKAVSVVRKFKYWTLISLPFCVLCILKFLNIVQINEEWNAVGGIEYGTIGLAGVQCLMFVLLDAFLTAENSTIKKWSIFIVASCVTCFTVTSGGSRTSLVMEILVLLIGGVLALLNRRTKKIFVITVIACTCSVVAAWSIGHYMGGLQAKRLEGIKDLDKEESIWNAIVSEESKKLVDQISQGNNVVNNKDHNNKDHNNKDNNNDENANDTDEKIKDVSEVLLSLGESTRIYLYRLALKEANLEPLFGQGVMSYQLKYGTYPHNVVLEMAADFGYIATAIMIGFVLHLMWRLWRRKDAISRGLLFMWMIQSLYLMVSGNLYVMPSMVFGIVYSLGCKEKKKADN